ncbi:hypothetical protein T4B_7758 [Trichinella pseudospiralis]|uniref:Uncharacterized protein n=1 Tax=Trichinella pseudospiralis TaxID=6337 RepID=A0A0V1I1G0_TRIPS|nr:hypothetical protein T4B_7758 [Trichinella pseudospiralis]
MYRLAEVELATLYPCIREVALNRGYQGCFKTKSNLSIVCDKGRQPSLRQNSAVSVLKGGTSSVESTTVGVYRQCKALPVVSSNHCNTMNRAHQQYMSE